MAWRKPNKYKAQKAKIDGHTFDSQAEARRYQQLKILKQAGKITDLELQPRFALEVGGVSIKTAKGRQRFYVADFRYKNEDGEEVIEDVKGMPTDVYKLKRDILAAKGIHIKEVKA